MRWLRAAAAAFLPPAASRNEIVAPCREQGVLGSAAGALRLGESKDRDERVVDRPQFVGREISDLVAEPLDVDGSELFDQNAGRVTGDGYLGSK